MRSHTLHIVLLFVTLLLSVVLLVVSGKYAVFARSHLVHAGSLITTTTVQGIGNWPVLVVYDIAIPGLTFLTSALYVILLHFDYISAIPTTTSEGILILCISAIRTVGWTVMSAIWTACELGTASVIVNSSITYTDNAGNTTTVQMSSYTGPAWCPQARFDDSGMSMTGAITILKNSFAWTMVVVCLVILECARRGWMHSRQNMKMEVKENAAGAMYDLYRFDKEQQKDMEAATKRLERVVPNPVIPNVRTVQNYESRV